MALSTRTLTLIGSALTVLVLLIVGFIVGRGCHPEPEIITGPPSRPDTILVSDSAGMARMQQEMERLRKSLPKPGQFTSDQRNLVDTVFVTAPDTIDSLPGRWYLDSLKVGESLGDQTVLATTWLESQDGRLLRRDSISRSWTPGPLLGVASDEAGVHLQFGSFQDDRPSFLDRYWNCGIECDLAKVAGGVVIGLQLSK